MSAIEAATRWGATPATYPYSKHPTGCSRLAVLFPGRNYPLEAPIMRYSALAAFQAGCDVLGVEYGYHSNRAELEMFGLDTLIDEVAGTLETVIPGQYSSVVFIGKSLGTVVQTAVLRKASFSVRNHVYLTPVRQVIPAIRQSERALVVVGDDDPLFGKPDMDTIADAPGATLHVIPGADHVLETGDYRSSVDVLKQVAMLCGDFCGALV